MDPNSILDPGSTREFTDPEKPGDWPGKQSDNAVGPEEIRFPGEDGGKSLAGMAQKDLTATLQLLAEQVQYITGASGAAIALRDHGEMVCRASAGSSAPEVGSVLQVDSGLSGESVRTQQTLRCDDASTDPRVNRESCEALGIASVVVMPLVQSNEVIGVFELFSDKAHVFQGRDITALERMGAMVFTVLEHAMAAHGVTIWPDRGNGAALATAGDADKVLPESFQTKDATALAESSDGMDVTQDEKIAQEDRSEAVAMPSAFAGIPGTVLGIAFDGSAQGVVSPALTIATSPTGADPRQDESDEVLHDISQVPSPSLTQPTETPTQNLPDAAAGRDDGEDSILEDEQTSKKPSSDRMSAEHPVMAEPVAPAVPLRSAIANLKKCRACGFPVSEGRQLCLDCEKKQIQAGNTTLSTVPEAEGTSDLPGGSAHRLPVSEPAVAVSPQFLSDEEEDVSWLGSHKYMIAAIVIALMIIGGLLLAR